MQTNTQASDASILDDDGAGGLPLSNSPSSVISALVTPPVGKPTVTFAATLPPFKTYTSLEWVRTSSSAQTLVILFTIGAGIIEFAANPDYPQITFEGVVDGIQKASVDWASSDQISVHFDAVIPDPLKENQQIRLIDPVIVISIKP